MRKTAIAILLVSSFTAQATNLDYNLGLGLSVDNNHYLGSSDETYVFRGGVVADDTHRFLGTYTFSNSSKLSKYLGSYDYLYGLDSENKFNLLAGVSIGYKNQDVESFYNTSKYVIGGQAGFNYRFTKSISTELGYRVLSGSSRDDRKTDDELYLTMDYRF